MKKPWENPRSHTRPLALIGQPILKWKSDCTKVCLPEHVLSQMTDKLACEKEVDQGIKRGILGTIDGIDSPFPYGYLLVGYRIQPLKPSRPVG